MIHTHKSNIVAFDISQVADIKKAVRGKKIFTTSTNELRGGRLIVRPPMRVSLTDVIALLNNTSCRYVHLDIRDMAVFVEGFTFDGRDI